MEEAEAELHDQKMQRRFFWKDASQVERTFQLMSRRFWKGAEEENVSGLNLSLIKPPKLGGF